MWIACVYCMRDVCYAGMYAQAGRCYADMYAHRYGMLCRYLCAMQCMLCGTGRRDGVRMQGMRYANMSGRASMRYAAGEACKRVEIAPKRAENRGIVDILYDGFRKCFVNCKFTFYITLSSYLKKLKIRKTRKSHSKM